MVSVSLVAAQALGPVRDTRKNRDGIAALKAESSLLSSFPGVPRIVWGILATVLWLSVTLSLASAQSSAPEGFDHDSTDFRLRGFHTRIECTACHIDGILSGTPDQCAACHDNERAVGKSVLHPPASENCASCHTATDWRPIGFDHDFAQGV